MLCRTSFDRQSHDFCRFPINSIQGFITGAYNNAVNCTGLYGMHRPGDCWLEAGGRAPNSIKKVLFTYVFGFSSHFLHQAEGLKKLAPRALPGRVAVSSPLDRQSKNRCRCWLSGVGECYSLRIKPREYHGMLILRHIGPHMPGSFVSAVSWPFRPGGPTAGTTGGDEFPSSWLDLHEACPVQPEPKLGRPAFSRAWAEMEASKRSSLDASE